MAIERWGSLSVADHNDTASLAVNVLLYDRLVLPVMTDQPDRNERAYWEEREWSPDLQRKRLEQLAELAVARPWNQERRAAFTTRLAQLKAERFDAKHIDSLGITRMILAQEQVKEKLPGVQHVEVIAAYNSGQSLSEDFTLADDLPGHVATQAVLLTRRLAVPELKDPEDTLKVALELSRDAAFREHRRALFEWQALMALRKVPPEAAVDYLCELTDQYNAAVRAATKKVYWRWALAVCGMGLGFATGDALAAGASAGLSLVQFATLDRKPAIEPGLAGPTAMFHTIETRAGLALRPRTR